MRTEERKRKGEQVEAGKACEKGERGKEDSISFKKKKKKKWEECGKVCKGLDECAGALRDLMLKSGKKKKKRN